MVSFIGACAARAGQRLTVALVAIIIVSTATTNAKAQTFDFTPSGAFASNPTLFSALQLTLGLVGTSANGSTYTVDNVVSGSFDGFPITSILAAGTIVNGRTVNNRILVSNGNPAPLNEMLYAGPSAENVTGFGFEAGGQNYIVSRNNSNPTGFDIGSNWRIQSVSGESTSSGDFAVTQAVPGPLAGAGMLSWLAVMLMGLAWRKEWLIARARAWLAAMRQRKVKPA